MVSYFLYLLKINHQKFKKQKKVLTTPILFEPHMRPLPFCEHGLWVLTMSQVKQEVGIRILIKFSTFQRSRNGHFCSVLNCTQALSVKVCSGFKEYS